MTVFTSDPDLIWAEIGGRCTWLCTGGHSDITDSNLFVSSTTMSPLPVAKSFLEAYVPPLLHYPLKLSLSSSVCVYVASLLTSNVSQVDRLWTVLPTVYTAYFALLPLWPRMSESETNIKSWIIPFVPDDMTGPAVDEFHPRALMILALVVRGFTPVTTSRGA